MFYECGFTANTVSNLFIKSDFIIKISWGYAKHYNNFLTYCFNLIEDCHQAQVLTYSVRT